MQINIQDIVPIMKNGWVAMDRGREWWWFDCKPVIDKESLLWQNYIGESEKVGGFDIAPADDWTKSLIKVGGK